jgi:hypothetical protein
MVDNTTDHLKRAKVAFGVTKKWNKKKEDAKT